MSGNPDDISRPELDASRDEGDIFPLADETVAGAAAGSGWLGYLKDLARQDGAVSSEQPLDEGRLAGASGGSAWSAIIRRLDKEFEKDETSGSTM